MVPAAALILLAFPLYAAAPPETERPSAAEAERPDQALARALEAESLRPDSAETLSATAAALTSLGRHDESLERLRRALAVDPRSYWLRIRLGETLRLLGRFEEARRAFAEAKAIDPAQAAAYLSIGYSSLRAGEKSRGVAEFQEFVRRDPSNPVALHHLGAALSRTGNDPQACALFKRALEILESSGSIRGADWAHTRSWYAMCQFREKRFHDVIRNSSEVMSAEPAYSEFWIKIFEWRTLALARLEQHERAEKEVRTALKGCRLPEPRIGLEVILCGLLQARGDRAGTLKACEHALAIIEGQLPDKSHCAENIRFALKIGAALEKIGAPREAERAYRIGVGVSSCSTGSFSKRTTASLHGGLMRLAARRGDCAGAEEQRTKAIEISATLDHEPGLEAVRQETQTLRRTCPETERP